MKRFQPAAIESAVRLVRVVASERAAVLFAALLEARTTAKAPLTALAASSLAAGAADSALLDDIASRLEWLEAADQDFAAFFGLHMIHIAPRDATAPDDADPSLSVLPTFSSLLETPLPGADPSCVPIVDGVTHTWVRAVVAAAGGETGHHFAVRLSPYGPDCADLAGHLAAAGTTDVRLASNVRRLSATLLQAELHAETPRPIVVVAENTFVQRSSKVQGADNAEVDHLRDDKSPLAIEVTYRSLLAHFRRLRAVYVWRVPVGSLPPELDGIVAGCIGPLAFDGPASTAMLALRAPHLDQAALLALRAMVPDPRKVEPALAATAALAAGNDLSPSEAALLLARSHGSSVARAKRNGSVFDPTLIMADIDPEELLGRASQIARGGRVLFWGPPAGGKSSFAWALCTRMLGAATGDAPREVVEVAAADILRTNWGATERLVREKFEEARDSGDAPLLIDEFDAFAGVREHGGATSNNGMLVRSLTDEFLRELDTFDSVPVVATCNDLLSIDAAARRRFHLVVAVGDELTPEREAHAWRVILGCEPPPEWVPIGAAVGDVAGAGARCRMLGRMSSQDFQKAIVDARNARLGLVTTSVPRRSVH